MEFDKPSTKYLFIATGIVMAAIIGYLGFTMYDIGKRSDLEAQDRKAACQTLQPKFNALYVVRSGFYEGQLFRANALVMDEYIRGDILEDLRPLGTIVRLENITIECPMLKTEDGE